MENRLKSSIGMLAEDACINALWWIFKDFLAIREI